MNTLKSVDQKKRTSKIWKRKCPFAFN